MDSLIPAAYQYGMSEMPKVRYLDSRTPPHISTLILLAGNSALSLNLFLPSLPGMAVYFDTEYRLIQLSVALYLVMNAGLQVIIGPISDKFGRRTMLLWALTFYCLATLGCVFAPNVTFFLIMRMLQAVIAVAMVLSRAIVGDIYSKDRAASMLGYVTMGMAVIPMIAPAIGGIMEELFGWKANFWLLSGFGLLTMWLVWKDLGETSAPSGNTLWGQFREYPELMKSPRFWGYCLAVAFSSGAFFAYLGGAPFVATNVYGLSPSEMGLYFAAPSIGYFIGNWFTGAYAARFGVNRLILSGTLIATLGMIASLITSYSDFASALTFFSFMTAIGIGNGLTISNGTAGMLSVRPHLAGTASGLGGAIMIGGGAAFSAIAGALLVPGSGAQPLIWLMLTTSILSLTAIILVIAREKQLGLAS